jgi:hypothetical protein
MGLEDAGPAFDLGLGIADVLAEPVKLTE